MTLAIRGETSPGISDKLGVTFNLFSPRYLYQKADDFVSVCSHGPFIFFLIRFHRVHGLFGFSIGEVFAVVGSCEALGSWSHQKAVTLHPVGGDE